MAKMSPKLKKVIAVLLAVCIVCFIVFSVAATVQHAGHHHIHTQQCSVCVALYATRELLRKIAVAALLFLLLLFLFKTTSRVLAVGHSNRYSFTLVLYKVRLNP